MNSTLTQRQAEHTGNPDSRRLAGLDLAGIAALGAVIAIHTSELSGKVDETAYLGFGYVLLIAASIVSIVLLAHRDLRGWILGGLTAAATFTGYVLTRTTGLPRAHGDVGNWGETIGVWSLIAEGLVIVLALLATSLRRSELRRR
jgi:surface polysaccharide O-acyltransferase-like enzyme